MVMIRRRAYLCSTAVAVAVCLLTFLSPGCTVAYYDDGTRTLTLYRLGYDTKIGTVEMGDKAGFKLDSLDSSNVAARALADLAKAAAAGKVVP